VLREPATPGGPFGPTGKCRQALDPMVGATGIEPVTPAV
jgi:hypothetical protein